MTTSGVDLSISGLATGFDWKSVITQLANAERSPELRWHQNQTRITGKNTAFDRIKTFMGALQTDVQALKDPKLFSSRTAAASDATLATASADSTAAPGTFAFNITQLATAAKINGTANIGKALSPTSDVSAAKVSDANFATAVTAGNFTINGKSVTVATADTLQQVFDKIAAATANNVNGSYDPATDKFTLTSANGSEIVLGSATDTSNFLQVGQLYNNASASIASTAALGHVNRTNSIYDSSAQLNATVGTGFSTAVTAGTFTVNGKQITVAATDSLQGVFSKIAIATGSTVAGSYNAATDKIQLTTAAGVALTLGNAADTSNFLQTAKLASNAGGTAISTAAVGGVGAGVTHAGFTTPITGDGNSVEQLQTGVSAGFGSAVTAGTFTINGAAVTIGAGDTLQTVFNNIATATGNKVTATYDAAADKITLTSTDTVNPITLGAGGDTSNFLSVTGLATGTSNIVTSAARIGGAHAQGAMSINGVIVNYNAGTDSLQNILDRINNSSAGVTASYDAQNDRFNLTNKNTGDTGIVLQDVTGNFLAATGLAGSTLTHGKNLTYTLNDGPPLVSQGNTITADSSSVTGLTVNALNLGKVTVTVGSDTTALKTAISNFIKDYNSVQTYISTQTASSTDSTGNVSAGILAADPDANGIIKNLRSLSFAPVAGLTGAISQLASLGIKTNGKDNTIELSDSAALDTALSGSLNSVQKLFTDSTNGVATQLDNYLTHTIGTDGTLAAHMANLTKQNTSIDAQIAALEKTVATDSAQWTKAFRQMETAQAQITQQLNYLTRAISSGSL